MFETATKAQKKKKCFIAQSAINYYYNIALKMKLSHAMLRLSHIVEHSIFGPPNY